ncbi:hypothetical protein ACFORL_05575 [Legionella dresdenensis]|uniref:LysM domain-containing protein n=1 Tax=Legionella dresdenensis TaxID=450200 RepID=A0ABV8CEZ3_9GAMM
MTQVFTGAGLGIQGSSLEKLGSYGPKGAAGLGQGGEAVYVNAANGNLVLKQSDGFMAGLGLGLDLFQVYNSLSGNWRFNSQTTLEFESDSVINRVGDDGHVTRFVRQGSERVYQADDGSTARIVWSDGSWHYQSGSGEVSCNYNLAGQLTSLTDRDGHAWVFRYEQGYLSQITDTSGNQTVTWLFDHGVLQDINWVSENKRVGHIHYDYDSQGRLTLASRDLGDGKTYWIAYDYAGDSNLITDIRQSDGTRLHVDYDGEGRVKCLTDGEGRTTAYEYFEGITAITNGKGARWLYRFNQEGLLTGIDGPENFHVAYHYENKRLTEVVEGNQTWHFKYNAAGDCVLIAEPSGQVTKRMFDSEHHLIAETRYQRFDGEHHPVDPSTRRFVYDSRGHLRFAAAGDGAITEYRYDSEGRLVSERRYLNARLAAESGEQTLTLDDMMAWAARQNPQAIMLTEYCYDWRGLLTHEITYTAIDASGQGVVTPDCLIHTTQYDAAGRLVEKSAPVNGKWVITYYFYDGLGRVVKTVDSEQRVKTFFYDDAHQQIVTTEPNGLTTIATYDKSGLLLCTQQCDSRHDFGEVRNAYDDAGRLIAQTGQDGKTVYYFYDTQGRLQGRVSASGEAVEYRYDNQGHCIQRCHYQQKVNPANWLTQRPSFRDIALKPSGQDRITQYVYNQYQALAFEINSEGAVIAYRYDAEGRVISKTAYANRLENYQPGQSLAYEDIHLIASGGDRTQAYYYDTEGRLIAEVNGEGYATAYQYDAAGHCTEICRYRQPVALPPAALWRDAEPERSTFDSISYCFYNAAGLKIADVDAGGYLTEYHYDARGLLIEKIAYYTPCSATNNLSLESLRPANHRNDRRTHYQYNDSGLLIEEQSANGLITTYAYNEQGLCISQRKTDNLTHTARARQFRYDALGRLVQQLDELGATLLQQHPDWPTEKIEQIWREHGIRYDYDLTGRMIGSTNALGQRTRYFYNNEGQLVFTVNAEGCVTENRYNTFHQLDTVIQYRARISTLAPELSTQALADYVALLADDRHDESTHYQYNTIGQITQIKKGANGRVEMVYNAFGELVTQMEAISPGRVARTSYDYDRRGLLRHRIDDANNPEEWQYDAFGQISQTIDKRGYATRYGYDRLAHLTTITNAAEQVKKYRYDAFGRVIEFEQGARNSETTMYDDSCNTLTITYADGRTTQISYNAFGDKIEDRDAKGQSTRYEYDEKGQLITVNLPEQAVKSYQYEYDAEGHLIWQQDSNGKQIRYTYDASGRKLTELVDPDGLKLLTTMTYDGIGRLFTVTNPAGTQTVYGYDSQGNLITVTIDPNGLNRITEYAYDERNQLIRTIEKNPAGHDKIIAYERDSLGRIIAEIIDPDGLCLTTRYQYDANNNVISKTDPRQHTSHFIYDANNRCRYQIDNRGVVTAYAYDALGNVCETTVFANRIGTLDTYQEAQIVQAIKRDPDHDQTRLFEYDNASRLIRQTDALGNITCYTYDENGNLTIKKQYGKQETPETLRATYFAYDGLNRLRYQIDPGGKLTGFDYNHGDELLKKTEFSQTLARNETGYTLEVIESLLQRNPAKDRSVLYAYDKAGCLRAQVSASGAVTRYQYDSLGHVTTTIVSATLLSINARSAANWDALITDHAADRISHTVYDAAGREIYRVSPLGHVVERVYDAVGNVVAEINHSQTVRLPEYSEKAMKAALGTDSEARITRYQYDANGRLRDKTDAEHHLTHYDYDDNGNLVYKTEANQAVSSYEYDEANQLIATHSPIMPVSSWQNGTLATTNRAIITRKQYDSFGNVTAVIKDADGIAQTVCYEYDKNNQLTQTRYPDVAVNAAGMTASSFPNLTTKTLTEQWVYNDFGQVIAHSDRAGHWTRYIYDGQGQLIYSIAGGNQVTQYSYDTAGNLITKTAYAIPVSLPDAAALTKEQVTRLIIEDPLADRTETYRYDPDNRLIETSKQPVKMYNARTGLTSWQTPITRYDYNAFGEVISTQVKHNEQDWAATSCFYNQDGLKTAVIDAEDYLTTYDYTPFGEILREVQYANRVSGWTATDYTPPALSANDRAVEFAYDSLSRVTRKTLKQVSWQRLTGNKAQYEKHTGDLTSFYQYDAVGNLIATTDPQGNTAYCYYDPSGQLIAKIAPLTQKGRAATTYQYDSLGQLVETHQWAQGAANADETGYTLKAASAADIITHNRYDNSGQLIEKIDGNQHSTWFSYDENGNVARSWQVLKQIDGSYLIQDKRYQYDYDNRLIQTATLKQDGSVRTEDVRYNSFGEIAGKGINHQFTTRFEYDNAGRLWRSNSQGYYQIYRYDLAGNLTETITASQQTLAAYGAYGIDLSQAAFNQESDFDSLAYQFAFHRQYYTYDRMGHVLSQDEDGVYDPATGQCKSRVRLSAQTVDRWGNVLKHTNALGDTTCYDYNAFDEVIRQQLPAVAVYHANGARTINPVIEYAYDELGHAIAMIDANGNAVAKYYDADGRIIRDVNALGYQRDKTYNLLGQLETLRDERSYITQYFYDHENRLVQIKTPTSHKEYQYDEAGQLIAQQTAGMDNQVRFWYNELGFLVGKQDSPAITATRYYYDDAGHKTLEVGAFNNSKSWAYDEYGRVTEHADMFGRKTVYTYNANGQLVAETSPNTLRNREYTYYSNGRLASFEDKAGGEKATYAYDDEGNVTAKSSSRSGYWAAQKDEYQYDALGRLVAVNRYEQDQNKVLALQYEYDANGNIIHTSATAHYPGYQAVSEDDYFAYDANNRMVINKGRLNAQGEVYVPYNQGTALWYDAAGNLSLAFQIKDGKAERYDYLYTGDNQLERIQKNGLDLQYKQYDEAGRLTKELLYNELGDVSEMHLSHYKANLLETQMTLLPSGNFIANMTNYWYDDAGNLKERLTTLYNPMHHIIDATEKRTYTYELWDSYQQSMEYVSLVTTDGRVSLGQGRRIYNAIDGQFEQVNDNQGTSPNTFFSNSALDGLHDRYDGSGHTSYLAIGGKLIGDVKLNTNGTQALNLYSGFTPTGAPSSNNFLQETDFKPFDGILPEAPQSTLGAYTVQAGDTLERIAFAVYGDSSLWYLIADANGISERNAEGGKSSSLPVGKQLTLPPVNLDQHYNNGTHKVLSSEAIYGNLSATARLDPLEMSLPTPVRHKKSLWKTLAKIAITVTAIVATVLSAGIMATLLPGGAALSGGLFATGFSALSGGTALGLSAFAAAGVSFAAGFIGSLAAQGLSNAFGLQHGLDVKGLLISALTSAAAAGAGNLIGGTRFYKELAPKLDELSNHFNVRSALEMMERDTIAQTTNLALRDHQHFDWLELGTTAVTAGILGSQTVESAQNKLTTTVGKEISSLINSELNALASGTIDTVAHGGNFKDIQAGDILLNNLGNAIGSTLASSIAEKGQALAQLKEKLQTETAQQQIESGGYCPFTIEEEGSFTPIPEGTYERFREERKARELVSSALDGDLDFRAAANNIEGSVISDCLPRDSDFNSQQSYSDGVSSDTLLNYLNTTNDMGKLAYESHVKYKINVVLNRAGALHRTKSIALSLAKNLNQIKPLFKTQVSKSYAILDGAINSRWYKLIENSGRLLYTVQMAKEMSEAYTKNMDAGFNIQARETTAAGFGVTAGAWGSVAAAHTLGLGLGSYAASMTMGTWAVPGYTVGCVIGYLGYNLTPLGNYVSSAAKNAYSFVWDKMGTVANNVSNVGQRVTKNITYSIKHFDASLAFKSRYGGIGLEFK